MVHGIDNFSIETVYKAKMCNTCVRFLPDVQHSRRRPAPVAHRLVFAVAEQRHRGRPPPQVQPPQHPVTVPRPHQGRQELPRRRGREHCGNTLCF